MNQKERNKLKAFANLTLNKKQVEIILNRNITNAEWKFINNNVFHLLDKDVPDIGVEPLTPSKFQIVKQEITKNAGNMVNWLSK